MLGQCYDDLIWDIIGPGSCAFKHKTTQPGVFLCSSGNSVNGKCDRISCPLANAQYATVREIDGRLYLSTKVIERQHLPAELWENTELPQDYVEAYKLIRQKLQYWEPHVAERCLLRLKKYREQYKRIRELRLQVTGRVRTIKKKQERRELIRQAKALRAAQIEKTVERELMRQLRAGKYRGIFEAADLYEREASVQHEEEYEQANVREYVVQE